jgi:transposase
MEKRYRVTLKEEERAELEALLHKGKAAAVKLTHARILLKADQGAAGPGWSDPQIHDALDVGLATVYRLRQRFVEEGLEAALNPKPSSRVYERKLDGAGEAHLVKLACSTPPQGRKRWTLQLLADRMVVLGYAKEGLSYETVRRCLQKTSSSLG